MPPLCSLCTADAFSPPRLLRRLFFLGVFRRVKNRRAFCVLRIRFPLLVFLRLVFRHLHFLLSVPRPLSPSSYHTAAVPSPALLCCFRGSDALVLKPPSLRPLYPLPATINGPRCQAQRPFLSRHSVRSATVCARAVLPCGSDALLLNPLSLLPAPHAAAIPRQAQRPLPLSPTAFAALRFDHVPCCSVALTCPLFSRFPSLLPFFPPPVLPAAAITAPNPTPPSSQPTALAVLRFAHVLCCSVALGASVCHLPLHTFGSAASRAAVSTHLGSLPSSPPSLLFPPHPTQPPAPPATFGSIQGRLFPAYFRLMALSSALSALALKLTLNPAAAAAAGEAAGSGAGGLQQIMRERHSIEKEAGIGQEVGLSRNREVARTNKELAAVNRRFGMWHGMSSLSNLVALCSLGANAWFLAQQLPV
ncbi:unnamed protein product [Closterium sp. NIES-65]|nr:unnamed protein product [Closterium sp. NIES-65]